MQTDSVRARRAKLEEDIEAFEHWQRASARNADNLTGAGHPRREEQTRAIGCPQAGRMARYENRPCRLLWSRLRTAGSLRSQGR